MNYEVAIIIPTLNEERFIAHCLDSIICQTMNFDKMDVMVVDGGSTDRTESIVGEYRSQYPNIRFLHNKKKIQSAAFNLGVANSSAPYIIRLDAHAVYEKKYIELCVKGLKEDESRGNVGGRCIIKPFNDSTWAQTNAILNHSRFGIGGAAFRVSHEAHNTDSVPFGAFPRKIVEEIGGMREDLPRGEDNEYNSRIRKAKFSVYFNPAIVSSYFARPTFQASCKQMYANGESIGRLFYIDRQSIGLRHLIPLLFVLTIIICMIGACFWQPVRWLLLAGACLYFLADLVASLSATRGERKYTLPLFALFFSVHISYGIGTIIGLFKGYPQKKKLQEGVS